MHYFNYQYQYDILGSQNNNYTSLNSESGEVNVNIIAHAQFMKLTTLYC